ncbi:tachykinin-like peptides receptor 86C [Hydra vulgaris]|uniref:Tachykinin-like peptides receptor 86C n=1 Tax=Hydra vulgaris TaxID=6087 RepID=A0ABM4B320_HYDVU
MAENVIENFTAAKFFNNTSKATLNESYTLVEIIIITFFIVIFLLGTIGNGFVLFYFGFKEKRTCPIKEQRSVPEYLFCVLAVVDFFASALNPLLYTYWTITRYRWHFSYWTCKILVPLGTIATTMSGGIFAVLSFDRQRTIVYPFKRHFKLFHIKLCLVLVFFYALLMNAHYAVNISLVNNKCFITDVRKKAYSIPTIIYFLINDVSLIVVINFTNIRIFSKILRLSPSTALVLGDAATKRRKENYKIIRLLAVLTTVFFVLTLPRDIFQFVHLVSWFRGSGLHTSVSLLSLYSFLKVFNVANSCVNPLIYYMMHKGFKRFIKECFCINYKRLVGMKRIGSSASNIALTLRLNGSPNTSRLDCSSPLNGSGSIEHSFA